MGQGACWLAAAMLVIALPVHALQPSQLGLIVNSADPLSVRIGEYYAAKRRILFSNVIRVELPPGRTALTRDEFRSIKAGIDEQVGPQVQAFAITWASPYRVDCMSITAALAFGFDEAFCAMGCRPTRRSPYFNSRVRQPYSRLGVRPTMALAAQTFDQAKSLIDRGVASDGSNPQGAAYLVNGGDRPRASRDRSYAQVQKLFGRRVRTKVVDGALADAHDVLFYFVGSAQVSRLDSLRFLPGAVADHLTSAGGQLIDSAQMSALRWLEAGATGSYGTVVEPCSMPQKFPHPPALLAFYLAGETLIEAYWKSVAMPGQGIFIGEPLAAPFRRSPGP